MIFTKYIIDNINVYLHNYYFLTYILDHEELLTAICDHFYEKNQDIFFKFYLLLVGKIPKHFNFKQQHNNPIKNKKVKEGFYEYLELINLDKIFQSRKMNEKNWEILYKLYNKYYNETKQKNKLYYTTLNLVLHEQFFYQNSNISKQFKLIFY